MFFKKLLVRSKKSIGGIQLDAVLSESHTYAVRVTKNPVEFGRKIADHAIVEPKKLTIVGHVTDTPLGLAAFGDIVDSITGLFGTSTSDNLTRSNAAYNALLQLAEAKEVIQVHTRLKLYDNLMIVGIKTSQDKSSSRAITIHIELEEIIVVNSQVVSIDESQLGGEKTKAQATTAVEKGRLSTITPTPAIQRSVLKSVADFLRD